MALDQADVEGEALIAIRFAGGDATRPSAILKLAAEHPYIERIEEVPFLPAPARTRSGLRDPDLRWIQVRAGLTRVARQWWAAHEWGEVLVERAEFPEEYAERLADRMAAAIIVPRPAFDRACADLEDRVESFEQYVRCLGRRFSASPKTVLLRLGEVRDLPVAILTEGQLWPLRGMMPGLPGDAELRAWVAAFERGEPLPRWLRITRFELPGRRVFWAVNAEL